MSQDSSSTPPPLPATPMAVEYQSYTSDPGKRAGKPSMLHWLGIFPALIFVAFVILFKIPEATRNTGNSSGAPAYLVGWMIAGFLFSLVPAWIIWFFSRSRTASTITFSVILLLMCLVTVSSTATNNKGAQQAAVQTATRPVLQKRIALDVAMKSINDARAISTLGYKDLDGIDRNLKLLDGAITANDELRASIETSKGAIDRELSTQGISSAQRQKTVAEFDQEIDAAQKRNESQVRLLRAAREMTAYLREHYGDWQYDSKNLNYVFKTEAEVDAFAKLQEELADAARAAKETSK